MVAIRDAERERIVIAGLRRGVVKRRRENLHGRAAENERIGRPLGNYIRVKPGGLIVNPLQRIRAGPDFSGAKIFYDCSGTP